MIPTVLVLCCRRNADVPLFLNCAVFGWLYALVGRGCKKTVACGITHYGLRRVIPPTPPDAFRRGHPHPTTTPAIPLGAAAGARLRRRLDGRRYAQYGAATAAYAAGTLPAHPTAAVPRLTPRTFPTRTLPTGREGISPYPHYDVVFWRRAFHFLQHGYEHLPHTYHAGVFPATACGDAAGMAAVPARYRHCGISRQAFFCTARMSLLAAPPCIPHLLKIQTAHGRLTASLPFWTSQHSTSHCCHRDVTPDGG